MREIGFGRVTEELNQKLLKITNFFYFFYFFIIITRFVIFFLVILLKIFVFHENLVFFSVHYY